MLFERSKLLVSLLTLMTLGLCSNAHSASFNLLYDDVADSEIRSDDIVGVGTFSYDGPISAGEFLLSELTNVAMSVEFAGPSGNVTFAGPAFDPLDLSLIGISITPNGGDFEFVFTGGSAESFGSLDILTGSNGDLSHEPEPLGGFAIGPRFFSAFDAPSGLNVTIGDYIGTTAPVPLPPAIVLFIAGLVACVRSRTSR